MSVRIAVIGNCQAHGLADCLRVLVPDSEVAPISWGELDSMQDAANVAESLNGVDILIHQPIRDPATRPKRLATIPSSVGQRAHFPSIFFTGFHPDVVVGSRADGLDSFFPDWHSILIISGFLLGLTKERTAGLFNRSIYRALGYFDEFSRAEQLSQEKARSMGIELDLGIRPAGGPPLYTPNHPTIEFLRSMALQLCRQLELDTHPHAELPPDPYKVFGALPIYPGLAECFGVPGSLKFPVPVIPNAPDIDLEVAVGWFYNAYSQVPKESLRMPRVLNALQVLKTEGI